MNSGSFVEVRGMRPRLVYRLSRVRTRMRASNTWISVASIVLVLGSWETIPRALGMSAAIFPPVSLVMRDFFTYLTSGLMFTDTLVTMRRLVVGLVLGISTGVVIGLSIGWYAKVRAAIYPLVAATYPIPKLALIPLLIIWLGTGDQSLIALMYMSLTYIVTINMMLGVETIPTNVILASQNLGASDWQIFRKVAIPSSLPPLFAAIRLCWSTGLLIAVSAEMILGREGLGHVIYFAGQTLTTERIFSVLALTAILGMGGYWIIDAAERRFVGWSAREAHGL